MIMGSIFEMTTYSFWTAKEVKDTQKNIDKLNIMISRYDLKNKTSNYYIYKWTRLLCTDFHVALCSNHAEGAHGNINDSIKKYRVSNFSSDLSSTINYVPFFFLNHKKFIEIFL